MSSSFFLGKETNGVYPLNNRNFQDSSSIIKADELAFVVTEDKTKAAIFFVDGSMDGILHKGDNGKWEEYKCEADKIFSVQFTNESEIGKCFIKILSDFDPLKRYSGEVALQKNRNASAILEGKDSSGQPIPQDALKYVINSFLTLKETESRKISDDKVKLDNGGGRRNGGYSARQTEAEKLRDRVSFVSGFLKEEFELENNPSGIQSKELLKLSTLDFLQFIIHGVIDNKKN